MLTDSYGSEIITATINAPEIQLEEDEILIKNWSGNQGILESLESAGVIEKCDEQIDIGFTFADKCRLLI